MLITADDFTCARLLELEERLLHPAVRADPAAVATLLTDEFREFGSSGRIFHRAEIIAALAEETRQQPPSQLTLADFRCDLLAPGVALVTYRSQRTSPGGEAISSLRSSIWVQQGGQWQLRFHQGTREQTSALQ